MHTVGIVLFQGVELLDFAGPAEVFIVADEGRLFRVVTLAETRDDIRTMGGIGIRVDATFEAVPPLDVIVVPGGDMQNFGPAGYAWLKRMAAAPTTQIVMSVCMGAMILAKAGLLEGASATTHHWGLKRLAAAAPGCTVVSDQRVVDSGRIVTTAGVTAGIDGALHVVARLAGAAAAAWTATEWMEHPSSGRQS